MIFIIHNDEITSKVIKWLMNRQENYGEEFESYDDVTEIEELNIPNNLHDLQKYDILIRALDKYTLTELETLLPKAKF